MKKYFLTFIFCIIFLAGCTNSNQSSDKSSSSSRTPISQLTSKNNDGQPVYNHRKYTIRLTPGKISSEKQVKSILMNRNFFTYNDESKDQLENSFKSTTSSLNDEYSYQYYLRYDTDTKYYWYNDYGITNDMIKAKTISYQYYPNVLAPDTYELKWDNKLKAVALYTSEDSVTRTIYHVKVLPDGTVDFHKLGEYVVGSGASEGETVWNPTTNNFKSHTRYAAIKPGYFKYVLDK